jgi:hypothetical protein
MWSGVGGRLNTNGLFCGLYRSRFCLKAVITLQRNGAAQTNAAPMAAAYTPTLARTCWRA